jgi:hypothetical protein
MAAIMTEEEADALDKLYTSTIPPPYTAGRRRPPDPAAGIVTFP